jgi:hypothetical protein
MIMMIMTTKKLERCTFWSTLTFLRCSSCHIIYVIVVQQCVPTITLGDCCNREGRRPLGRPRCRWEDNIKMDLREIGFGDVDWIHLAQDRDRWQALVNMVMNLRVP